MASPARWQLGWILLFSAIGCGRSGLDALLTGGAGGTGGYGGVPVGTGGSIVVGGAGGATTWTTSSSVTGEAGAGGTTTWTTSSSSSSTTTTPPPPVCAASCAHNWECWTTCPPPIVEGGLYCCDQQTSLCYQSHEWTCPWNGTTSSSSSGGPYGP